MSVRHSIASVLIAFSVAACSVASTPSLPLPTPSAAMVESPTAPTAPTATPSPDRTASPAPSPSPAVATPAATPRPSATVSSTAELKWGKPSRIADLWVDAPELARVPAGFVLLTPGTSNMSFSPDGRSWGSADLGGLDSDNVSIADMTQSGDRMVAVGEESFENADGSSVNDALVLTSDDGRHWQQISDPRFKNAQMELVGSTRQGIVAFGWAYGIGPAIWTSPDGSSWLRATNESGLAVARGVTTLAERDGALLAFVGVGATEQRPATTVEVWRTEGRAEWQPIGELPRSAGMEVHHAVYGNGRWYAFGWKRFETDKPVAWTSPDGATWTRVKVPEAWSLWGIADLVGFAGGFVAVTASGEGPTETCGSGMPYVGLSWTSVDGRTWHQLRPIKDAAVLTLAIVDDHVLGIGNATGGGARRWWAALPKSIADPPPEPKISSPAPAGAGCGG